MCVSAGTLGRRLAHGVLQGVEGEGACLDGKLSSLSCLNDVECDIFNVDDALVESIAAIISAVAGTPDNERWGGNERGGGEGNAGVDKAV